MNSEPIFVKQWKKKFLFGLVKLNYSVEDRRPDLTIFANKYKHYITVKILWKRFNWTIHSMYQYEQLPYDK